MGDRIVRLLLFCLKIFQTFLPPFFLEVLEIQNILKPHIFGGMIKKHWIKNML